MTVVSKAGYKSLLGIIILALLIGALIYGVVRLAQPSPWQLLEAEFSQTLSGTMSELENGEVYFNQYSFYAGDGRLCRIYYYGEQDLTEGLVCWHEESGWQYMLAEEGPDSVTQDDAPSLIREVMAELEPGDTLSLAEERQALAAINDRPSS
ncbi:hypothetical protein CWE09_10120 [Aliidiomarina minuta]|uniref:Uncharacterized protein n=1 Tax=Aliidiomarina minuta TaxID=880057 RepID=A0A432WA84_9GAMM|nr:hypothetical protein [Aliidiomarina minuta]RUO27024.1 hypothetical protein CWE09_10120 [Aliidiomarina minuta]